MGASTVDSKVLACCRSSLPDAVSLDLAARIAGPWRCSRTWRYWRSVTSWPCSTAKSHDPPSNPLTGRCLPPSAACFPSPLVLLPASSRSRWCAGTAGWSPGVDRPPREFEANCSHSLTFVSPIAGSRRPERWACMTGRIESGTLVGGWSLGFRLGPRPCPCGPLPLLPRPFGMVELLI